jgi:hypothetical protein
MLKEGRGEYFLFLKKKEKKSAIRDYSLIDCRSLLLCRYLTHTHTQQVEKGEE